MSLKPIRITVGITLDRVLFPITFIELISSLEKNGFEISQAIPYPRPIGRFIGSGQLGIKGKTTASVDGGGKSISMTGSSLEDTIEEYDKFNKTILADYSLDLDEFPKLYYLTGNYEYKTKKNTHSTISDSISYPKIEELSEIVDESMNVYAIQFGSADTVPNDKNWFDIKITPDVQRNDGYVINVVYRKEDRETYRTFISHIEENIVKIIRLLEG